MTPEREVCGEHSGVCERIKTLELNVEKIWKRIDAMASWVMAGMGALLVQAIIFIVSMLK